MVWLLTDSRGTDLTFSALTIGSLQNLLADFHVSYSNHLVQMPKPLMHSVYRKRGNVSAEEDEPFEWSVTRFR